MIFFKQKENVIKLQLQNVNNIIIKDVYKNLCQHEKNKMEEYINIELKTIIFQFRISKLDFFYSWF